MNKECTTVAPDTRTEPVTVLSFTSQDVAFEADLDGVIQYPGTAANGAVLVTLNVDGESFDRVRVEDSHDSEKQLVQAIDALTRALDVLRGFKS